jgi:hypothetical protein
VRRGRWSLIPASKKSDSSSLAHLPDVRERIASRSATVRAWLRVAFTADRAPRGHRVHPKVRALQIGTAAAAMGVLGVIGNVGSAEQAPSVHAAAQVLPLQAAAAPPPVASPLSGPVEGHPAPVLPQHPAEPQGPKVELPKIDAPKIDAPKIDTPKIDTPKIDTPKIEVAAQPEEKPKDEIDGWIIEARKVLRAKGVPEDKISSDDLRTIIEHESGGDPSASNNWDSNAAKGTPSKGLMQTIDPTFKSFALPGHQNVWNPVDNIIAGSLYSIDRYGSVSNVPGVVGKSSGGSYQGY